jgi:opacity protein-like surface antigen
MKLNMSKTLLATLLATLGASAAQAAALSLVSGSVSGSLALQTSVNDQAVMVDAYVDDWSGAGILLGAGSNDFNQALTPAGTLSHSWRAGASLDTTLNPASAAFQTSSLGVLGATANGRFDGSLDTSTLLLEAELAIVSTGEAAGTAVRLDVSGVADSLFGSTGPGVEALPTFDLVVRDADSLILGSWQGLAAGSSGSFSFSFNSQVGQRLSFSLSHYSSLQADAFDLDAAATTRLETSTLLNGSISVSAVPEPETYALLLAGLAAIGLLHGRHRSAA